MTWTVWPTASMPCWNTKISYSSVNSPVSINIFLPAISFLHWLAMGRSPGLIFLNRQALSARQSFCISFKRRQQSVARTFYVFAHGPFGRLAISGRERRKQCFVFVERLLGNP